MNEILMHNICSTINLHIRIQYYIQKAAKCLLTVYMEFENQ